MMDWSRLIATTPKEAHQRVCRNAGFGLPRKNDQRAWRIMYRGQEIMAGESGLESQVAARRIAFEECLRFWLIANPLDSAYVGRCVHCGELFNMHSKNLAIMSGHRGRASLHFSCYPIWAQRRRIQAIEALAKMGITPEWSEPLDETTL